MNNDNHNRALFLCAVSWLDLLEHGENLLTYFEDHRCQSVAIYGAGDLGRILAYELMKNEVVEVPYYMDVREAGKIIQGIPVFHPQQYEDLPIVDMVVVSAFAYYTEVVDILSRKRIDIPIVSLKNIIDILLAESWRKEYEGK